MNKPLLAGGVLKTLRSTPSLLGERQIPRVTRIPQRSITTYSRPNVSQQPRSCLTTNAFNATQKGLNSQCPCPSRSFLRPSPVRTRTFSGTTGRHKYKTVQEAKARYQSGPFSWKAGALFLATGVGLIVYFQTEKARMQRKRIAEQTKGIGKPRVGGSFELIDHNGNRFTSDHMKGKYALVYFGFTHCPDICPEELDKMADMIDLVKKSCGNALRPVFITCDPARDTPAVIKEYLKEFHPDLLGLTGTYDEIKAVCKAYRVYFSTPPDVKPGQDYLVDHSIYFYLMDPDGDFVEALGRHLTEEQCAKIMINHINDWKGKLDKS